MTVPPRLRLAAPLLVGVLLLAGCHDEPVDRSAAPTSTTAAAAASGATTTSEAGPKPTVEAELGCAPNDASQITVTGRNVGSDEVVVQVLYDGKVVNWSYAQTGPTVGAIFQPEPPREAYETGEAQARIVTTDVPAKTIVETTFRTDDRPSCG